MNEMNADEMDLQRAADAQYRVNEIRMALFRAIKDLAALGAKEDYLDALRQILRMAQPPGESVQDLAQVFPDKGAFKKAIRILYREGLVTEECGKSVHYYLP
jgi:hypothetical protein